MSKPDTSNCLSKFIILYFQLRREETMEISDIYMIIGFSLAAYSVVANDSVQTLGTFIASNSEKKKQVNRFETLHKLDQISLANLKNQNNRNTVKVIAKGTIIKEIEESLLSNGDGSHDGVNHLYAMD